MPRHRCPSTIRSLGLFTILCAALIHIGCVPPAPDNEYQAPPPQQVDVATPLQQKVVIFQEETGETEAVEVAEVRSRVNGFLEKINFIPGQKVKKGDVLYTIEKDTYQAAVDSAQATVGTAVAAIDTAKAQVETAQAQVEVASVQVGLTEDEFKRVSSLLEKGVVNQSDYDKAKAERDAALATKKSAISSVNAAQTSVKAAEAEAESARAKLEQAKLDLNYTDVLAPIDGQVTKTEVKLGNLVENGMLLATVVNVDQIYVNFSISDSDALKLQQARIEEGGEEPATSETEIKPRYLDSPALVRREIDPEYIFPGRLNYVDEQGVDPETGTLGVRAIFDNPEELLFPGLFVYVRVPIRKMDSAFLLPEKNILRDQVSSYVLVVNGENKVERKDVNLGQTFDGHVVVNSGIDADDRVIVSGAQRLRPESDVTVRETITLSPVSIPGLDSGSTSEKKPKAEKPKSDNSETDGSASENDATPDTEKPDNVNTPSESNPTE